MPSPTRPSQSLSTLSRVAAFLAVIAVGALGIWVTGALITNDSTLSMVLTAIWMALAAGALLPLALRRRALRIPLAAGYAVVAVGAAIYLGPSAVLDRDAGETVVTAAEAAPATDGGDEAEPTDSPRRNARLARGRFSGVAHPGRGVATVIRRAEGGRVLTLTGFEVDNGPDLRVYLVRGEVGESSVGDFDDLGALKGNTGDQQYRIPRGVKVGDNDSVVIWCRAFSVAFATAPLERG